MLQGLRIAKNEMGAEGVKIVISGRFNGQDRGSSQWVKEGSIPLQTLNIPILYSEQVAHTIYGVLGIKVWLSYK
jgi:small subunit ribosomal protein S3